MREMVDIVSHYLHYNPHHDTRFVYNRPLGPITVPYYRKAIMCQYGYYRRYNEQALVDVIIAPDNMDVVFMRHSAF